MVISFVIPTFERDAGYLDNLLLTLHNQTLLPHEIVIVDMNVEDWLVEDSCDEYPLAKRISVPWTWDRDFLNIAWGMNVGIRATDPESDYLLCTGVEMMFSLNYVQVIMDAVAPHLTFLAPCGFLPPEAPLVNVIRDWDMLVSMAGGDQEDFTVPVKPWMDGTIKVMTRDWWIKHRGYDETLVFKPISDNVNYRAVSSGLERYIIPFDQGQVLHQWHEPNWELIENSEADWDDFLVRAKMLVTNTNGWGELSGPRASESVAL